MSISQTPAVNPGNTIIQEGMPPAIESLESSGEDIQQFQSLSQEEQKALTPEEKKAKMQEATTKYIFDQMTASIRRHNQEMQKQIQKQKEEDEGNN